MSDFSDFMIFPSWHQPLTRIGNDHVVSVSPFSEIKHLLSTSIWIHEVIKNDYGYCSETHGRIERERENIFFFLFNIITAASNNIPVGWQGKKRASLTQLARNLMITNFHLGQLFISPFHLTDILCTGIVPVSLSVRRTWVRKSSGLNSPPPHQCMAPLVLLHMTWSVPSQVGNRLQHSPVSLSSARVWFVSGWIDGEKPSCSPQKNERKSGKTL